MSVARRVADKLGASVRAARERRLRRRLAGTKLLHAFAARYPDAFVIEIGANDGINDDPIRPFVEAGRWAGIMVEPSPEVFERLRRNYAGVSERIAFENVAIADHDGTATFFHVDWVDGEQSHRIDVLGSLSLDAAQTSGALLLPDEQHRRIVRDEVACLTFDSLCRKHGVERLNLLLIDAEGYDFEIVKQLDLERHRPRLLVYEHLFLSPADRAACRALVERAGYETLAEQADTWCLDTGPADELTETWRGLRPAAPADSFRTPPTGS